MTTTSPQQSDSFLKEDSAQLSNDAGAEDTSKRKRAPPVASYGKENAEATSQVTRAVAGAAPAKMIKLEESKDEDDRACTTETAEQKDLVPTLVWRGEITPYNPMFGGVLDQISRLEWYEGSWDAYPGNERMRQDCLKHYLDPDLCNLPISSLMKRLDKYADEDDDEGNIRKRKHAVDQNAIEKKLEKGGSIEDVFEYVTPKIEKGYFEYEYKWSMECEPKADVSKKVMGNIVEDLCDGSQCVYPTNYDNFGYTPFNPEDGFGKREDETKERLQQIRDAVASLLRNNSFASLAHASWTGYSEVLEFHDTQCHSREYCFFETTDKKKYLLVSSWEGVFN